MKVADLIAPPGWADGGPNIIRFCWAIQSVESELTVTVISVNGREEIPRDEARDLWKKMRKSGWIVQKPGGFPRQTEGSKLFDAEAIKEAKR